MASTLVQLLHYDGFDPTFKGGQKKLSNEDP